MLGVDWLSLRILFFFALAIAFILTERRSVFDFKQKALVFGSYFLAVFGGLMLLFATISTLFKQ